MVLDTILPDLGVILEPVCISFLNSKNLKKLVFQACLQVILLLISEPKFRCLGLPNRGFRIEGIAKIDLSQKSFFINFGVEFCCFLKALGAVFLVFWALKTGLEIKGCLVM